MACRIIRFMRIRFTKMQGAGNDFVVLDETRGRLGLSPAQYRWLADRHFGVGADQILSVRPSPAPGIDFEYAIHNADGGEVEHCGNGARCFVRYVVDRGLTDKRRISVKTVNNLLQLQLHDDGRVTVDMGAPVFDLPQVPFDPTGLASASVNSTSSMASRIGFDLSASRWISTPAGSSAWICGMILRTAAEISSGLAVKNIQRK